MVLRRYISLNSMLTTIFFNLMDLCPCESEINYISSIGLESYTFLLETILLPKKCGRPCDFLNWVTSVLHLPLDFFPAQSFCTVKCQNIGYAVHGTKTPCSAIIDRKKAFVFKCRDSGIPYVMLCIGKKLNC
jgi:hypothetical protein